MTAFSFFFGHSALEFGVLPYAAGSAIIQTMTVSCSVRGAASGEKWLSNLRSLSPLILAKSMNGSRNLMLLENGTVRTAENCSGGRAFRISCLPSFCQNSEVSYCPRYHQVSGMEGQERSH